MGTPAERPLVFASRAEYRRWAAEQVRGRFERIDGAVVAMAPERVRHARVKALVWQAFEAAIRAAGLPCEALPDGITVEVGDGTDYEPDALVNCGPRLGGDEIAAPSPVIVVEVLFPSTKSIDTGAKLAGYFRVPSVQHYLIVNAERPLVIHHRRRSEDSIDTRLMTGGGISLDPPGLSVAVADFYPG